jgi:hypothetical protein
VHSSCSYLSKLKFMNAIQKLDEWSKHHHSGWMDAMRILLGLILHFKGLLFMWHTSDRLQRRSLLLCIYFLVP